MGATGGNHVDGHSDELKKFERLAGKKYQSILTRRFHKGLQEPGIFIVG